MSGPGARIGLAAATAIVVGNMIGTGVFASIGFQLADIPSGFPIIALWTLGGIIALCGAFSYAELSAALPRSGGEYHLLGRIFHPALGFVAGWISITASFAAPIALSAMTFAAYLGGAFGIENERALAAAVLCAVTVPHLWRIEAGAAVQIVFTAFKVAVAVGLAFAFLAFAPGVQEAGFFFPKPGDAALATSPAFGVSLVFVMYAYSGWNATVYLVDDVRDPGRIVPRSLVIGTLLVTVVYVALNAGFMKAAPVEALAGELDAGLVATRVAFGEGAARAVAIAVGIGLVSSISAMTWAGSRVAQTVGADYGAFRFLARTTAHGVPAVAVGWQFAIALILLMTSTFETVLVSVQLVLLLSSLLTVSGIFVLRKREPDLPRPARAWGYPVTPLVFLVATGGMIVHSAMAKPGLTMGGLALVAVGLLVYLAAKPKRFS